MELLIPPIEGGGDPDFGPYFDGIVGRKAPDGLMIGDQFDDWLMDPVGYEDHRLRKDSYLEALISRWRQEVLAGDGVRSIAVPRSSGSTLPALALPLELRVITHAVIGDMAPTIRPQLLRDKVRGFDFHDEPFPRFEAPGEGAELAAEAAIALLNFGGADAIDLFDVVAFSERARFARLAETLGRAGARPDQIKFLEGVLGRRDEGLPSIDDAFAFVYNYYLAPADQALAATLTNFFRYRDEYFLASGSDASVLEQALGRLGLSAAKSEHVLDAGPSHALASDEPGEEIIGPIGEGYLVAVFEADCQSDCFEISYVSDPASTDAAFFERCRSGTILDGIHALPSLRGFRALRLAGAWLPPPTVDAGPLMPRYLAAMGANKTALESALAGAVRSGSEWQLSWAAPLLSDLGELSAETIGMLRGALSGSIGPAAALVASVALARSSSLTAEESVCSMSYADDSYGLRSLGLAAHFLRRRGSDGLWNQLKPKLEGSEPHLVRFLDRL